MNRRHERNRWRDRIPGRTPEPHFRWRGKEVSRLENLADAVFGFSVTLLVVALEVPRDFAGLRQVLEGFPAFVASFAMLMFFWNAHYRFFRRYGLEDSFTRTVNYAILLLVMFSVYPLKFLFSVWFGSMFGFHHPGAGLQSYAELSFVFRTYGSGLALTWAMFALLYRHAYRLRDYLQLTAAERLQTAANIAGFSFCIAVCLASIALTFLPVHPEFAGLVYFAIGPGLGLIYWRFGRRVDAALAAESARR